MQEAMKRLLDIIRSKKYGINDATQIQFDRETGSILDFCLREKFYPDEVALASIIDCPDTYCEFDTSKYCQPVEDCEICKKKFLRSLR